MTALKKNELFIPVNKGRLFCRVFGENNPPVIVMHGGPGLGQDYLLPQLSALQAFSTAIFYDQRGAGRSTDDNDWQASPFQAYVNDVEAVRQAFGLDRVSLLAHSWGGVLASLYALAYPQRVDKMMYVNAVPLSCADYMAFVKHRNQLMQAYQDELNVIRESAAFRQGEPDTVKQFYLLYFKNYFVTPQKRHALTLTMSPQAAINNFKVYEIFYDYMLNHPFDLYQKLKALNKPSLVVACDKDVVPYHYMEKLHNSIPASRLTLIKNCGHFPYIEQPEILFSMLCDFMKGSAEGNK